MNSWGQLWALSWLKSWGASPPGGGNGGGSGAKDKPWGERPVDYVQFYQMPADDDALDAAMFAVGAGLLR